VKVGDSVDIAGHGVKKVKSMQVFKQPVQTASQGDRVGVCVTALDPDGVERGLMTMADNPAPLLEYIICTCEGIKYFKLDVTSKSKYHVTIGHNTVMAVALFFKGSKSFGLNQQYRFSEGLTDADFVLLKLETPVLYPPGGLYLASKLDLDIHAPGCRLAFHGQLVSALTASDVLKLSIVKDKVKTGTLERADGSGRFIVSGLLKKDSDISKLVGQKVKHASGCEGIVEGPFGKSGRVRVSFDQGQLQVNENVILQVQKRLNLKL
jgi:selenocysteine-specific elongation factor